MGFSMCLSLQVLPQNAWRCNISFSYTTESCHHCLAGVFFIQAPGWLCGFVSISVNLSLIHLLLLLFQPPSRLGSASEVEYTVGKYIETEGYSSVFKVFIVQRNIFKVNPYSFSTVTQMPTGSRTQDVVVELSSIKHGGNQPQLWHWTKSRPLFLDEWH